MKRVGILLLATIVIIVLSSCGCKHEWKEATCDAPKTCVLCNATEGVPITHQWQPATCTNPKICSLCGLAEGVLLPHEWIAPTCETPKTCFVCKVTDGSALGHDWLESTCVTPKTCSICGIEQGEAPGHSLSDTVETRKATCSEVGLIEGTCTVCNKVLVEEIPMIDHTPSEQKIIVEATYDSAGKRGVSCRKCGVILEEESYELTEKEKEAWYKKNCEVLPYKTIARNPDDYIGTRICVKGEVSFVWEEADSEGDYSVYFVYTRSSYGFYMEDPFYILVEKTENASRILAGDIITFYGEFDGIMKEYGDNHPKMVVKYYELKN